MPSTDLPSTPSIIVTTDKPTGNRTFTNETLKCLYHERWFENGETINPKELDYDKELETCIEHCVCENQTIVCYQVTCGK